MIKTGEKIIWMPPEKKKKDPKGESERWAGTSPGTPGTEQSETACL